MGDLQLSIEQATKQIQEATTKLRAVMQRRTTAIKAGLHRKEHFDSVVTAQAALNAAEVRLRTLYESKGDWVSLTHDDRVPAAPAPLAVG